MQQYEQFESNFSTSPKIINSNVNQKAANNRNQSILDKIKIIILGKNPLSMYIRLPILLIIIFIILFFVDKSKSNKIDKELASNTNLLSLYSSTNAKEHDAQMKYNDLGKLTTSLGKEIKEIEEKIKTKEETLNNLTLTVENSRFLISDLTGKVESQLREMDTKTKENDEILAKISDLEDKLKQLKRSKKEDSKKKQQTDYLIDSTILQSTNQAASLKQLISTMISTDRPIALNLLYRASRDGYDPVIFHQRCDYQKETVVLIRNSYDDIFGGYTTQSWDGEGPKKDKYSFVFNLNIGQKYPVSDKDNAIYCSKSLMPSFGKGDIIMDEYKAGSFFPISYGLGQRQYELTNYHENFKLIEVEVFAVEYL